MSNYQTFRHYRISQDAKGAAVELWRSDADIVCLAVDTLRQVFVELHVAIIDPSKATDLKTFQQLTQLLGQVRSSNILEMVDSGEDEGAMYAVTEFVDGERLDTYLARCNPLPIWYSLQILSQITDGLLVLQNHPRLMANLELFNSTVQLMGDTPEDLCVKLSDFRLAMQPSKAALDPATTHERIIQDMGRLLAYMLTGSSSEISLLPNALRRTSGEMASLVEAMTQPMHPAHPSTVQQLAGLIENAILQLSPENGTIPPRMPPSLRPKLPLHAHLTQQTDLNVALAGEYQAASTHFDSAHPYQLTASSRDTKQQVTVQLLPPERLIPRDFVRAIRSTQQRVNALDHPHLLRVQLVADEDGKDLFVEESPGKFTLADLYQLKSPMSATDAVILLEHLQEAGKEADACGLTPVVRSLRHIYLQFRQQPGQPIPQEKDLAELPLEDWPPFYLRMRTYPTTLSLTQPGRFVLERQVGPLPSNADPGVQHKLSSLLTAASSRDFALITYWLTAGHATTGEQMRHLLGDYLAPRKGRGTPLPSKDFLERLSVLVGRSAMRKTEVKKLSRKPIKNQDGTESVETENLAAPIAKEQPTPTPVATPSAPASLAPAPTPIPPPPAPPASLPSTPLAFGEMVSGQTTPTPVSEPARAFGASPVRAKTAPARRQQPQQHIEPEPEGPVGFAEALFGKMVSQDNDDDDQEPIQPAPKSNRRQIQAPPEEEDYNFQGHPGLMQSSILSGEEQDKGISPHLLEDETTEKPRHGLLILWIILLAALIAAVMAHFLETAFWLPKKGTEAPAAAVQKAEP